MPIRNPADYRSIVWVMFAVLLVVAQYCNPGLGRLSFPVSCYVAIACGTIAHNHNHRSTFTSRRWDNAFGHVLTIFYGYPTLMWIPTHNLNHHRFVNRPGGRDGNLAIHEQAQSVGRFNVSARIRLLSEFSDQRICQPGQGSKSRASMPVFGFSTFSGLARMCAWGSWPL